MHRYIIWYVIVLCTHSSNWLSTVKPVFNDHLMGYFSAFWSSSRWPLAKVKWYLQFLLKYITEYITGNKFHCRGGRYRQVSLYNVLTSSGINYHFCSALAIFAVSHTIILVFKISFGSPIVMIRRSHDQQQRDHACGLGNAWHQKPI